MTATNVFILAADNNPQLLPLLRSNSSLATSQDSHGYSLPHAAVSYNHLDLLRILVNEFHVDVNIKDEDGETPLFVVESVEAAQCLLDELKAEPEIRNDEGMTAEDKIKAEGDNVAVADFLRESRLRRLSGTAEAPQTSSNNNERLPPLPPNVKLQLGSLEDEEALGDSAELDPEFRQRIEALAARDDFGVAEGQQQLREIITDAIRETDNSERKTRRRPPEEDS
ncbi:hypothetical protein ACLMJK_003966 [Lecanora helva]